MFFFNIYFVVVIVASLVIFCSNPVYSVVCLVLVVIVSGFLLLILNVEFLTYVLFLLYIGAIAILFLFIIMLLQINKQVFIKSDSEHFIVKILYGVLIVKIIAYFYCVNIRLCVFICMFSYEYISLVFVQNNASNVITTVSGDVVIYLNLFTQTYYFLTVGFILLFAMVGAISLCVNGSKKT